MTAIQHIFRTYADPYLAKYRDRIPHSHLKVIDAISSCRTDTHGVSVYACNDCGELHGLPASCGNRHCPTCQGANARHWLNTQLDRRLPGHHFLLTFTVPQQIRDWMRANQRIAYNAMFAASSAAIAKLARDPRHIGADKPGFTGVLHTWGRQLQYHPHIHYLAPYVFRVAISNSRIVSYAGGKVTFRWKKPRSHRWRTTTVDAAEFIRRFLQHVLPHGLQKVRHYGLMHSNCAIGLDRIRALVRLAYGFELPPEPDKVEPHPVPPMLCPNCGGTLRYLSWCPPVPSG